LYKAHLKMKTQIILQRFQKRFLTYFDSGGENGPLLKEEYL